MQPMQTYQKRLRYFQLFNSDFMSMLHGYIWFIRYVCACVVGLKRHKGSVKNRSTAITVLNNNFCLVNLDTWPCNALRSWPWLTESICKMILFLPHLNAATGNWNGTTLSKWCLWIQFYLYFSLEAWIRSSKYET